MGSTTSLQYRSHNHRGGTEQGWHWPISGRSQGTCRAEGASETSGGGTVENQGIPDHVAGYFFLRRSEITEILSGFCLSFFSFFSKGGKRLFSICQPFHLLHAGPTATKTD